MTADPRGGSNGGSKSRLLTDYSKSKANLAGNNTTATISSGDVKPSSAAGKAILSASASRLLSRKEMDEQDLLLLQADNNVSVLNFDSSMQSLTFLSEDGDDDDDDEVEDDLPEEYANNLAGGMNDSGEVSLTPEEILLMQSSQSSFSNSRSNFKSATSKRRLFKRRSRRSSTQVLNQSASNASNRSLTRQSSASKRNTSNGSSRSLLLDYVVAEDGNSNSSINNNGSQTKGMSNSSKNNISLTEFFEERSKTTLLPGSTTEDLTSAMNAVARGRGIRGGRPGSTPRRTLPKRSYTAPEINVPVITDEATVSTTSALRDYSKAGASNSSPMKNSSRSPGRRNRGIPRRTLSHDGSIMPTMSTNIIAPVSTFSSMRKKGPIARMAETSARMNQSSGNLRSMSRMNQSVGNIGYNSGGSRRAMMDGSNEEYEEDMPTAAADYMMSGSSRRPGGRRLPPRCKSADGSVKPQRTTPRRTRTDPTNDNGETSNNGSFSKVGNSSINMTTTTSANSFLTGSRIRRITPGSGLSGSSKMDAMSSSLRNVHSSSNRSKSPHGIRSVSPTRGDNERGGNIPAMIGGGSRRSRSKPRPTAVDRQE